MYVSLETAGFFFHRVVRLEAESKGQERPRFCPRFEVRRARRLINAWIGA